ncbi:hypothetical protein Bca4012_007074 [Brassica carinata]
MADMKMMIDVLRSLALLYLDLRSSVAVDCLRLVGYGVRDSSDFAAIFVCSGEEIRWLVESLMLRCCGHLLSRRRRRRT